MSFLDDIFKPINALFDKGFENPWDRLARETENLNLEGVEGSINEPLRSYETKRELSENEIYAITQRNVQNFTVIDVNPYYISNFQNGPTTFTVQPTPSNLISKLGNLGEFTGFGQWSTVEIPIAGSFLQFEYLPALVNVSDPSANVLFRQNPDESNYNVNYRPDISANPEIFIQFDSNQSPLMLLKDGMSFETSFKSVYLTFKTLAPRFSVTLGSNARIQKKPENLNQNPAFAPGVGLYNNNIRHYTPFCFTTNDGALTATPRTVAAGATTSFNLINPLNVSNSAQTRILGSVVGWITSLSFTCSIADANPVGSFVDLFLYMCGDVGQSKRRMLVNIPVHLTNVDSTGGVSQGNFSVTKTFAIPQRFSLFLQGAAVSPDMLRLSIVNSATSGATVAYKFSIEGYVYGGFSQSRLATPFGYGVDCLAHAPFPEDYNFRYYQSP